MDWKLFATTFVTIFLAEMGDKTQLTAFSLSAQQNNRWIVFIATVIALVCASAIGVIAGGALGKYVKPVWIQRAAGALFIVLGVVTLVRAK